MQERSLKIVLFQPEIPHNAGAAIRICAGMNAQLHLIRPLGFIVNDKHLARVALGYHDILHPTLHNTLNDFLDYLDSDVALYLFSSKADTSIAQLTVSNKVALLFGSETRGVQCDADTQERLDQRATKIKIPQADGFRCHNLSNSIAIGAYEVLRQWGFGGMW